MSELIAIDHGNHTIKTPYTIFPAGLADSFGIADETVEYKGKHYSISHRRIPHLRDKTQSLDYFILTLIAFGRKIKGLEESVVLAVGLPPAHFKTGRAAFEAYFSSRSPIEFRYNKSPKIIYVERVMVYPQAYAAAMTRIDDLKNKPRVFVIDIGGQTVDTLLMRNGLPDMTYTMSLDGGVNRLCNDIARRLSGEFGVHAEQDQIEAVLLGENTLFDYAAKQLICGTAENFTKRLLFELREQDIDLRTTPSLFIGGGSLLLRKYIECSGEVKSSVFIENSNANALGYQLLAERAMQK